MAEKAILFDSSKCTACKGCQIACKCWNNLPSPTKLNAGEFKGTLQNPPDLQPNTRLIITFDEAEGPAEVLRGLGLRPPFLHALHGCGLRERVPVRRAVPRQGDRSGAL